MKEGNVTLSRKEQRRLMVLNHLGSGAISGAEAAGLLGLSERQVRRLRRAYAAEGAPAMRSIASFASAWSSWRGAAMPASISST